MTGDCGSCGTKPLYVNGDLPFFVVRSHAADLRPTIVRLCPACLERTVKGGALVEQDVVGRMSLRLYEEICRRLGSCPPETRHYERLQKWREAPKE